MEKKGESNMKKGKGRFSKKISSDKKTRAAVACAGVGIVLVLATAVAVPVALHDRAPKQEQTTIQTTTSPPSTTAPAATEPATALTTAPTTVPPTTATAKVPTTGDNAAERGKTVADNASGSGSQGENDKKTEEQRKEAEALAVARQIADSIGPGTDLERVEQAAQRVAAYCSQAAYTMDGDDYDTAYGVFIKGEYSCAGSTRALGMVLTCMGYKWEHVNEHMYTHQWCKLTMDGQVGWADGQIGMAGYGRHPAEE